MLGVYTYLQLVLTKNTVDEPDDTCTCKWYVKCNVQMIDQDKIHYHK